MKKFKPLCPKTGLLLILLTALASCRLLTNDLRGQRIAGQDAVYNSTLKVGTSARALVADDLFKSVVIEIQAVKGFTPSLEALNHLQDFLAVTLNKPNGIEVVLNDPIPSPGGGPYTILDARNIEERYRRRYTSNSQVAVYLLFLDGHSADNFGPSKTLGQAHRNTSIVIYEKTLRETAAAQNGLLWPIEATIIEHEFGHVLGLVNLGAPLQSDHHHAPEHPRHCKNDKCLMHFTTETPEMLAQLRTAPPILESECVEDLKALARKK